MAELPTESEPVRVVGGDMLDVLPRVPADWFDSVVTDPPSSISFMGKKWDTDLGGRSQWVEWLRERLAECLRVTKPSGRLLCWAIPRRSHWTALAVEDAGWVIEDKIYHLFGTGFPKAKSKLKPAAEEWILARKPGPILDLNIDGCRVPTTDKLGGGDQSAAVKVKPDGWDRPWMHDAAAKAAHAERVNANVTKAESLGRWPAHLTHDGSDEVTEAFAAFGERKVCAHGPGVKAKGMFGVTAGAVAGYHDKGTAARFFYAAKASKAEREHGGHVCQKPLSLMRWLCRLVCPPGGRILDPFAGSGTTLVAAVREGFRALGIDNDAEPGSVATARRRVAEAMGTGLFAAVPV